MGEDETIGSLIDLVEELGGSAVVDIDGKSYAITVYDDDSEESTP